ncbi:MAG: hypothetical protein ACRD2X_11700, partial [Vicinamibacteraceae bacterium]
MIVRSSVRLVVIASVVTAWAAPSLAQAGRFERTLSVSGPVMLEARTGSGSITVRRGGAGAVQVIGTIRAHKRWLESGDVESYIRQVEAQPPITQDGNRIRLALPEDEEIRKRVSISYD